MFNVCPVFVVIQSSVSTTTPLSVSREINVQSTNLSKSSTQSKKKQAVVLCQSPSETAPAIAVLKAAALPAVHDAQRDFWLLIIVMENLEYPKDSIAKYWSILAPPKL